MSKLAQLSKPVRPLTSYFIFRNERLKNLPVDAKGRTREIHYEWCEMNARAKAKYEKDAKRRLELYMIELEKWKENNKSVLAAQVNRDRSRSPTHNWDLRRRRAISKGESKEEQKPKNQGIPSQSERLKKGFQRYMKEKQKTKTGKKTQSEWAYQLQVEWNQLTEAQRANYCDAVIDKGGPKEEQPSTSRPNRLRKSTRAVVAQRREVSKLKRLASQPKKQQPENTTAPRSRHSMPKQDQRNQLQGRSRSRFTQA